MDVAVERARGRPHECGPLRWRRTVRLLHLRHTDSLLPSVPVCGCQIMERALVARWPRSIYNIGLDAIATVSPLAVRHLHKSRWQRKFVPSLTFGGL
jgi:hypothetical protein